MKFYIKNPLKWMTEKNKIPQNERKNPFNIPKNVFSCQTSSLSSFDQTRNNTKLAKINNEQSKGWALQSHINQRILK